MNTVCGIDEAGRGPIIGPMVIAGVLVNDSDGLRLNAMGVKDSKLLTNHKREELYGPILGIAIKYQVAIIFPEEIDMAVNGIKLNRLEAKKSAEIINSLNPDTAIIDCPSPNIPAYTLLLRSMLTNKNIKLVVEHKADFNYPAVAAASVIAKVTRDREIAGISQRLGMDIGSGYPSDPNTVEFIKKHYKNHPEIFRKSWQTYKNLLNGSSQASLLSFSGKLPGLNPSEISIVSRLKSLGYAEVLPKTEHEKLRLKAACTVVFYKSGKILVQGNPADKMQIEKIINP